MILLKDIYIENFMSIEQLSISFEEDSIVAITGENGSGKSALLYAIAFALTGYRKGESYRDYVRTGCDSAHINLNATLKGYPLNIDCVIASGTRKTNLAPTKRVAIYRDTTYINSDYNQFAKEHELEYIESLMFLFQGKSDQLINMRPSERSYMLRHLFRFDFKDIVASLKVSQESLKMQDVETTARLREVSSRVFEKQKLIRTLTVEGIDKLKAALEDIVKDLHSVDNVSESTITDFNKKLSNAKSFLANQQTKLQQAVTRYSNLEKSIKETAEEIDSIDIDRIQGRLLKLQKFSAESHGVIAKLCTDITSLNESKKVLGHSEKELINQLVICKTGKCHACGHDIDETHVIKIQSEKDKISKELASIKKALDIAISERDQQQDNLDKIDKDIKKFTEELSNHEKLVTKKTTLEANIESYKADIVDKEAIVAKAQEDLDRLLQEKTNIDSLKVLLEKKKDLESQRDKLKAAIAKGEEDIVRNAEKKAVNEQIDRQIAEQKETIKKLTNDSNDISLNLADTKTCIDIFDTSFPNFIIVQACKQLEDYINTIIQKIFPYMTVALKLSRNGVSFYYVNDGNEDEWVPISMASGAQKTLLGLAYQIALARLYGLNCVLLDEADAAMNETNASYIYNLIAELTDFQQIIFISHRKESIEVAAKSSKENSSIYYVKNGQYSLR